MGKRKQSEFHYSMRRQSKRTRTRSIWIMKIHGCCKGQMGGGDVARGAWNGRRWLLNESQSIQFASEAWNSQLLSVARRFSHIICAAYLMRRHQVVPHMLQVARCELPAFTCHVMWCGNIKMRTTQACNVNRPKTVRELSEWQVKNESRKFTGLFGCTIKAKRLQEIRLLFHMQL